MGVCVEEDGGRWYFSRKQIEENSPSRQDGMSLKKETCLRKSYCRFLEDLGKRFKLPQVTIATAIILCHRFFLRQSHSRNDSRIIATACMFLASKSKETVCTLKDIVVTSYQIIHNKDFGGNNGLYEVQKEVVLTAETLVLTTLGFDLNVPNPYEPLVEGIKRVFKVGDQTKVAQVAWSLVNDAVRTSLLLQFQPHYIAAGAIFLAAKLLKQKPIVPWKDSDIGQLDPVLKQMLELYDQVPQVLKVVGSSKQPPRTTVEAPKPSSLKRKALDCPDKLADRKQQRVEYLSEDRRNSDRDHKRYDRSYDRGQWYPSRQRRLEDERSWRRGGHREYDRERVRGH